MPRIRLLACALLPVCAGAVTNVAPIGVGAPEATLAERPPVAWDLGADLRVRHEVVNHNPQGGLSGQGGAGDYQNWIRTRTRVWGCLENERFRLYSRVGNEFRWYPTHDAPNGNVRNWSFPDELYLDNLYLDLKDLFDDRLDLRLGRQDFLGSEAYGSMRILGDGNGSDDSRSDFFDAVRARFTLAEKEKLDLLGIWLNARDAINWGDNHARTSNHHGKERDRNTIIQGSHGLVESGGGLYHRSRTFDNLPMDYYWIFKRESHCTAKNGDKISGRDFHTFGTLWRPRFTANLSSEVEGAWQVGEKDTGSTVGGYMGYGAVKWEFAPKAAFAPWAKGSCYYMSGDRHRDGDGDSDHAWDCVWARWPQFSNLLAKSFEYGIGYWSNLVYPAAEAGFDWEGRVSLKATSGPLCAAVADGLGYGDGGKCIGWFSTAQITFPLFKGLWHGRGTAVTHLRGELLNPTGDYYITDRPAYYLRWDVSLSF